MSTRDVITNGLESNFTTANTESKVRIRSLCAALYNEALANRVALAALAAR